MTPKIPYYSATLYDPRDEPACDADYWVDNLRHTVRFAAAVQAALEDGYRVFGELAPHPLLTHAVEQTARSLDMPLAALAGMRREQELPHGLRGFLADLHSAGAAVDFSVLYPGGRLVDAPLPTWTHRQLILTRDSQDHQAHGASPSRCIRCWGARAPARGAGAPRLAGRGRHEAHPWLADHQIHNVAALPGAAYCEMALAAARTALGEAVRSPRHPLRADAAARRRDARCPPRHPSTRPASSTSRSRPTTTANGSGGPSAVLHAARRLRTQPARARHRRAARGTTRAAWTAPSCGRRSTASASSTVLHSRVWPPRTPPTATSPRCSPRSRCPGAIRSQQAAYGVHPALLDACFQSVVVHPAVQNAAVAAAAVAGWRAPTALLSAARNAHYCLHPGDGITDDGECEADIDVLDEHGTVLLTVRGLRMGTGGLRERACRSGAQRAAADHRMAAARTARRRSVDAGSWLLISTSDAATSLATQLADALKVAGRAVHDRVLAAGRQHADHRGQRSTCAAQSALQRHEAVSGRGRGDGATERPTGDEPVRPRQRVCRAPGAHRPRAARSCRASRPGCTSSPGTPRPSWPATSPTWSRPGCVA